MFQKSVVLVSRYPYVNLFERLVKVRLLEIHGSYIESILEHETFVTVAKYPERADRVKSPVFLLPIRDAAHT